MKKINQLILILTALSLSGCLTPPPKHANDICKIFDENISWYYAAKAAKEKWGVPINVPMAIMYQESSFKYDAAPRMKYSWGIPIGRASNAYGYAQAKEMTWADYKRETGNYWATRDSFADAVDFIGWFTTKTHKINKVPKNSAYRLYLNYHEGWGGYKRKNYNKKPWLIKVSHRLDKRSKKYARQLRHCKKDLESNWFWKFWYEK